MDSGFFAFESGEGAEVGAAAVESEGGDGSDGGGDGD